MSALEAPIDYRNLEEELHAALAADKLYKLQNDAKIRAIEQGVPTYEHFRQMVIAILVICRRTIKRELPRSIYTRNLLDNFYIFKL